GWPAGTGRPGAPRGPAADRAAGRRSEAAPPAPVLYSPLPNLPSGWAAAGVSGTGARVGQGASGTGGRGRGPVTRPAWTWQANALASWMLTLGSLTSEVRSLAEAPTLSPAKPQWIGNPTW